MAARGLGILVALVALLPVLPAGATSAADTRDLTTYVNPLSGSFGAGFPMVGASLPFAMIQQGPDTGVPQMTGDPVNYDGYSYQDTHVYGFSLCHFDGAGIHISGDLPFMPTTGSVTSTDPAQYQSAYSHADEVSVPGYYAVGLTNYSTRVELASTARAGIQRYTFPATTQANVLLNASLSVSGLHPASVDIVGNDTLQGIMLSDKAGGYVLYYKAVFDRAFTAFGTWGAGAISAGTRYTVGSSNGAYVTFDTTTNQVVNMRVAISYVDAPGAAANLAAEIPPGTTLDQVRLAAHDAWNARLHDLEVDTTDSNLIQTFYTNLYRALTMPALFDDADGRYTGFDRVVRSVTPGHHHYTNLSLWDTYRTQNPLLELIEPAVARDIYLSLLDDYDQNGQHLPKWTDANLDYLIMGGDSATSTIADGVMRGILQGSELTRAYAALLHQATQVAPPAPAREHLDKDVLKGYIPYDVAGSRAAAETQEYAIADAAVYQVARRLGTSLDAAALKARAGNWQNLMDPGQHFIRPRNDDGTWANPCSDNPVGGPCVPHPWDPSLQDGYQEATGWQQLWLESHDVAGLATAIGGSAATSSRMDTFFSTALTDAPYVVPTTQQYSSIFGIYYIGTQFTPANEPDLHSPWLYDWLGQPYKAQKVVRAAMQVYNQLPTGLPGNDDTGTMSSWFVLASLGIYAVTPGVPVWELNSPSFEAERIHLGSPDRTFTISAPGASIANKYVQSASLDTAGFDRPYLTQCEVQPGRQLTFTLGPTANMAWGANASPPSLSDAQPNRVVDGCADRLVAESLAVSGPQLAESPLGPPALFALVCPAVLLARRVRRRAAKA